MRPSWPVAPSLLVNNSYGAPVLGASCGTAYVSFQAFTVLVSQALSMTAKFWYNTVCYGLFLSRMQARLPIVTSMFDC